MPFVNVVAVNFFSVDSEISTSIGTGPTSSNPGISTGKGSGSISTSILYGGRGSSLGSSTTRGPGDIGGGAGAGCALRGGCRRTTTVAGHFSMTGAETNSIGSGTIFSATVGFISFAFPFHPRGWCTGVETEATSGVGTILGLVLRFVGVIGTGGADIEGVDRNWRRSFSLPRVCREGPAVGMVWSMRSKLDLY